MKYQALIKKIQRLKVGKGCSNPYYLCYPSFSSTELELIEEALETKTTYYENLLKENIAFTQRTQKIAIALGIGIFLLLAIAYFWKDENERN